MTPLQLVRVHEPEAVREILAEADKIVYEIHPSGEQWAVMFGKAVDLLAARIPITPMPQMFAPPDLRGLRP